MRHIHLRFWNLMEEQKVALQVLVELQDSRDIATAIAIVGCRPNLQSSGLKLAGMTVQKKIDRKIFLHGDGTNRNQILLGKHVFKTLLDELVCATNQVQTICFTEFRCHTAAPTLGELQPRGDTRARLQDSTAQDDTSMTCPGLAHAHR